MRVAVPMPKVNYEMEFGIVGPWQVSVGEAVSAGQVIGEIETEKANLDLEAPAAGMIVEIVHAQGVEVPVLEPMAWIETDA